MQAGVPLETAKIAELEAAVAQHGVASLALLHDRLAVRAGLILVIGYGLLELFRTFLFLNFLVGCLVFITGLSFMVRDLAV